MLEVGETTALFTRSSKLLIGTSCRLRAAKPTGEGSKSEVKVR